jgi:hypothetical protein
MSARSAARSARFDQLTDLGEHMGSAAGVPCAESHAILLRPRKISDRHDVLRTAGELDEVWQDTAAGNIERQIDTAGSERAYPIDEALAVGQGLGTERAQVVLVGRTGGADHARATGHRELDRGAADATGGSVDEQCAATLDADLIERTGGGLDGGRQRGGGREVERRRDRGVVRQHRQLGLRRSVGAEAEHPISDGHVGDARAQPVDNPRRFVAEGLRELGIHQAPALLPVAQANTGGAHCNPDLTGTWLGIGKIDNLQDLRAPEPAETDDLHHRSAARFLPRRIRPDAETALRFEGDHGPRLHRHELHRHRQLQIATRPAGVACNHPELPRLSRAAAVRCHALATAISWCRLHLGSGAHRQEDRGSECSPHRTLDHRDVQALDSGAGGTIMADTMLQVEAEQTSDQTVTSVPSLVVLTFEFLSFGRTTVREITAQKSGGIVIHGTSDVLYGYSDLPYAELRLFLKGGEPLSFYAPSHVSSPPFEAGAAIFELADPSVDALGSATLQVSRFISGHVYLDEQPLP